MKPHFIGAVAIGATTVLITAVGCGEKASAPATSSPAASSSSSATGSKEAPAAEKDYSAMLITAENIAAPGDTLTAQEPTVNPGGKPGAATVFSNADDTREIGDTIFVLPDAQAAATALQGAVDALGGSVTGGTPEPAQVGTAATQISGTSPDGAKAVTVLVFTQGTAFVTLEFDSAVGDPVPPEFVLDVAQKQDEKVKAALGG